MKSKPPPNRHKFAGTWDEIEYLYHKLLYWFYQRAETEKARPYAERLERLLPQADPDHEAIFGAECRSLVCQRKGNLQEAIKHRENEIRLIHRLRQVAQGTPYENAVLNDYDYGDLSDRMDLLAELYHDSGNLDKAIRILKESKELCNAHGIKFDGKDLLQRYLEEKGSDLAGAGYREEIP